jgi:serine/threonine protein kinase
VIGRTLAHYEIASLLGKDGRGEAHQASDRKLGRDVAIKLLPDESAKDSDRVPLRARGQTACFSEPSQHRIHVRPGGI